MMPALAMDRVCCSYEGDGEGGGEGEGEGGGVGGYHDFMQHRAGAVIHLVKLIDATDPVVTEHQRSPVTMTTSTSGR